MRASFFLAFLGITLAFLPVAAADHFSTPLMVIRFNQPRVYYEQPLYNALNRAAQAKADVRFQIISYAPANPRLQPLAENNFRRVLAIVERIGVPRSRIDLKREVDPALSYSEVHIYVR